MKRTSGAAAVLALFAAGTAGCGPSAPLRLDLNTISVTVPRAIAPAEALLAPSAPAAVPLPPLPAHAIALPAYPNSAAVPVSSENTAAPTPLSTSPVPIATAPPAASCPSAPSTAQPALPASVTVTSPPAAGTFSQTSSGSYTTPSGAGSLAGLTTTTLTSLPDATLSNGQMARSWRVTHLDVAHHVRETEIYDVIEPSNAPGATQAGIYLVGMSWNDPVRGTLSFAPSGNGLQVMASPVSTSSSSAQYAGIATDPSSLTTIYWVSNVQGRKRVDVCGQIVDTWTVALSGSLTSPTSRWNFTWNQQWGTAYGAALVQDTLTLTAPQGGSTWTRELTDRAVPKEVTQP